MTGMNLSTKRTVGVTGIRYFALPILMSLLTGWSSAVLASQDDGCVVQISQPLIDYGRKTAAELLDSQARMGNVLFGKQTITVSALCESETVLALSFNGSAADENSYRFAPRGSFTLKVLSAQLDGKPVRLQSAGAAGNDSNEQRLRPGVSLVPQDGPRAAKGQRLTLQVEVETHIEVQAAKARSEDVWQGSGQFSVESFD